MKELSVFILVNFLVFFILGYDIRRSDFSFSICVLLFPVILDGIYSIFFCDR